MQDDVSKNLMFILLFLIKQQENVQKKLLEKLQQPDKNSKLSAEDKIRNQASQWAENQQSDTGNGESQEYPQYRK